MKELTAAELYPLIFWMLDLHNLPANLAVIVDEQGHTRCSTETRIHVPDSMTRRKFAFY
jgi:hypothetical protein